MNLETSTILWIMGAVMAIFGYFLKDRDSQLKESNQKISDLRDTQIRHDERLSKHDTNFENIESRLDKMEQKFDARFDKLDNKLDELVKK